MNRRQKREIQLQSNKNRSIPLQFQKAHDLIKEKKLEQAQAVCKEIAKQEPNYADNWNLLAIIAMQRGQYQEALDKLSNAMSLNPKNYVFYNTLATIYGKQNQIEKATAALEKAYALQPDSAQVLSNLSILLLRQEKIPQALKLCQRALKLAPDSLESKIVWARILERKGQQEQSIQLYKEVITQNPNSAAAYMDLGKILLKQGQPAKAIAYFQKVIDIDPYMPETYDNLGQALRGIGKFSASLNAFQIAVRLKPDFSGVYNNLGSSLKDQGLLKESNEAYLQAMQTNPQDAVAHSNLLFFLIYNPQPNARAILQGHLLWQERHTKHVQPEKITHGNVLDPDRKLRIGYVSGDFCIHSVSYFIEPILSAHDPEKVEVCCYHNRDKNDAVTERLKSLVPFWRDIWCMNDHEVIDQIQSDQIDILVDLTGHTGYNRLPIFARKPAPIQVTYLGYPATTGLQSIDYRFTDAWADPMDRPIDSAEKLYRLPLGFLCYRPFVDSPDVRCTTAANEKGYVTFGSFNVLPKINDLVIETWCRILQTIPTAHLILKTFVFQCEKVQERYYAIFEAKGIERTRLHLLAPMIATYEHLKAYHEIDIALDPFPYNGTTTTCEALWMGVPVVTLASGMHAGRVGVSLLSRIGHPELIAHTVEEYIALAIALAQDLPRIQQYHLSLRGKMQDSSLCKNKLFTKQIEDAYRDMWQCYCNQTAPICHQTY